MTMIPTKEEYENALLIVKAYETERKRLTMLKVEEFKIELLSYFKSLKNGIKEISIHNWNNIFLIMAYDKKGNEYYDEDYGGEYDDYIETLAKKYDIEVSMDSDQYGK